MIIRTLLILTICTTCGFADNISRDQNLVRTDTIELYPLKFSCSDSWFGRDKAHHFLLSAFLTAGSYYVLYEETSMRSAQAMKISIGYSFSLGVAKEVRDSVLKGRAFSLKDLAADMLGIGMGVIIFNVN